MLPDKFIYTPWLAPPAVLKTAKVVLGGNYPERMVDDKVTKEANLKLLKAAYAAKMQGTCCFPNDYHFPARSADI